MKLSTFQCSKNCGHYQNGTCLATDCPTPSNAICFLYTESPYICELCGKHLVTSNVIYEQGKLTPWHIICGDCSSAIGTCQVCSKGNQCSFQQDTSIRETPYIAQTVKQGNAIMQTQVKNPARIKLTCEKCACYKDGNCFKEENKCCDNFNNAIKGW